MKKILILSLLLASCSNKIDQTEVYTASLSANNTLTLTSSRGLNCVGSYITQSGIASGQANCSNGRIMTFSFSHSSKRGEGSLNNKAFEFTL